MDDDFDLYGEADIYGTAEVKEDEAQRKRTEEALQSKDEDSKMGITADAVSAPAAPSSTHTTVPPTSNAAADSIASTSSLNNASSSYAAQQYPPNQQTAFGGARPGMPDEPSEPSAARVALAGRPKVTDPSVQNALYVGELDWWVSDADIRKIANDIGIPLRLDDITFSEHKVNGKSKGVAFVETVDEDEARRLMHWFETNDINFKRASVNQTTSANGNPFKTLPKDPPPRDGRPMRGGGGGGPGGMRGAMAMGAREGRGRGGGGGMGLPMAGAPIRMGGAHSGPPAAMAAAAMMNPMMMGMMGGGGGQQGGGGRGGFGRGRGGMGGGGGHYNPNFFGGGRGGGMAGGYNNNGGDDRERKRYRQDENY